MVQAKQDLVDFLKERSILGVLDERVLSALGPLFQEITCKQGDVIFRQGDTADAFYIIKQGTVEVIQGEDEPKLIACLAVGDCFGEMAAYNEKKRTATIRVPESAVVLKLPMQSFDELQVYFPEVRTELIKLIDRRLAFKSVQNETPGLQGNLAVFDLPTIIQAVVGPRQVGTLALRSRVGKISARISVRNGRIMQVTFGHLSGEPAFFELLTHNVPMDFVFEVQNPDAVMAIDRNLSSKEPYILLIEGARRADELPKLMMNMNWPQAHFRPNVQSVDWKKVSKESEAVGKKIWLLLEVGLSVQQLTEKLPFDRYAILTCLSEMLEKGLIRTKQTVAKPPVDDRVPKRIEEVVKALNQMVSSMQVIIGKNKVGLIMRRALEDAGHKYPHLAGLAVDPETLVMEFKSPERSSDVLVSLQHLSLGLLWLASQSNQPENSQSLTMH